MPLNVTGYRNDKLEDGRRNIWAEPLSRLLIPLGWIAYKYNSLNGTLHSLIAVHVLRIADYGV
jgi:hypothetical protein